MRFAVSLLCFLKLWKQDWISDSGFDEKGKGRLNVNGRSSATQEAADREAALRASTVVVPPGDEVKNISCPVCKESLKSEFLEDEEEWVWRNAIRVKDKVRLHTSLVD